jgi:antitoxin MazE
MGAPPRKPGNPSGVITPNPLLAEIGLAAGDAVGLTLEEGRIVLAPAGRRLGTGRAEASRAIAEAGDDAPVWPEFADAEHPERRFAAPGPPAGSDSPPVLP